jgi:hypothetical protein
MEGIFIMEDAKSHYAYTLKEVEARGNELAAKIADMQRELRENETAKVVLWRLLGISPAPAPMQRPNISDAKKFANVSVRWAILWLLSETKKPLTVSEIATALQDGGVDSNAADFNANVSSVLSTMRSKRQEVDVTDGRWAIAEVGTSAIEYIKATKLRKFFKRGAVDVVAPTTPNTKGATNAAPLKE